MLAPIRFLLWAIWKFLITLRYRIRIEGLDEVRDLSGPVLILPNHPAFVDPPVVFLSLWRIFQPRPLVFEGNFHNPVLYPFIKLIRAVPLPDMERPSAKARARTEQAIAQVIDGLRQGQPHILWPAGKLWRDGLEHIGGAKAVGEILRAVPNVHVILVRTRGLWGSMGSFAPTASRPNHVRALGNGALILLANLVFFTPRRRVTITLEHFETSQLPGFDRDKLNPWLEAWYNAPGAETPTFVPYHFLFGRRTFEFPPPFADNPQLAHATPEIKNEVTQILEKKLNRKLSDDEKKSSTVIAQLGMDSLDRMDLTLEIEQRFGYSTDQSPYTIGDLWLLAQGLAKEAVPHFVSKSWFRSPSGGDNPEISGATIAEAFILRTLAHPGDAAAADDLAGVLSYRRMLAGAITLSRRLASLPGTNLGLLLPASVACDIAFLALQLAGKVPVVLNWTTGPVNLEHAVDLLELKAIVTSNRFIDRLDENLVKALKNTGAQLICLEDLRGTIGRRELLGTLLAIQFRPGHIRSLPPKVEPDQPAVVLFTSGSEKAPKAVPLTHTNLLSNQQAGLSVLGLTRSDCVLGFLPAFHSFGLSITGLMPLLAGIRVVRHPDPTAATTLARKVADYRTTLLAGTPTFVNAILDRARNKPELLQSLQFIFVGAEKCPDELIEKCQQQVPAAKVLEGYGITECAPVISVNPPSAAKHGTVGKPLPNVNVSVVKLESPDPITLGDEVSTNTQGMMLVSGPNVFPGYIGPNEKSPFVERNGKRWYITGDLAEIDADGYIRLAGRLKRFLKAGGEMISLPALEEPLVRKFPPTEDGPLVAVEGIESPRRLVLFTTQPITLDAANDLLHAAGFRGILRLDEVRAVDKIPTLGTGKTDYKQLRAMIQAK
jgi:long-chain-fatty-acid--[acyl-carrier-protein] ligase